MDADATGCIRPVASRRPALPSPEGIWLDRPNTAPSPRGAALHEGHPSPGRGCDVSDLRRSIVAAVRVQQVEAVVIAPPPGWAIAGSAVNDDQDVLRRWRGVSGRRADETRPGGGPHGAGVERQAQLALLRLCPARPRTKRSLRSSPSAGWPWAWDSGTWRNCKTAWWLRGVAIFQAPERLSATGRARPRCPQGQIAYASHSSGLAAVGGRKEVCVPDGRRDARGYGRHAAAPKQPGNADWAALYAWLPLASPSVREQRKAPGASAQGTALARASGRSPAPIRCVGSWR